MNSKHKPLLFIALVFISLLLFYTAYDKETKTLVPQNLIDVVLFNDFDKSLSELNKVSALAAIGLISVAFILGPLSRMFPKTFAKILWWRKTVGLSGFAFALLHSIYAIAIIYQLDLDKMLFSNPKALGFVSGLIALLILFLMSITSTAEAVKKMGYKKWKMLQRTGYIALFLAIIHFIVLEIKPEKGFDVRPYGTLFLFIALIALILRILIIFLKLPEKKTFEEHAGKSSETGA